MGRVDEVGEQLEVVNRLIVVFPDVPADSVRAAVTDAWAEFDGRPIRDFVPVLAERHARLLLHKIPRTIG